MSRGDLAMVVASALLHAGWNAAIKGSAHPLAFNLLQALLGTLAALLLLPAWKLHEWPAALWGFVAATGLAHGLYLYFLTRAYERAPLSVVYPIVRSTPALLPLLAMPLLGESISPGGAAGIAVVVAGMWLATTGGRLAPRALLAPGTGFAYLTLLATVAYSLLDKRIMADLEGQPWSGPAPRSVVFFSLLWAAHTLVFAPLALPRISAADLGLVLRREGGRVLVALAMSVAGYGLILEALRRAPASYVVAVRQTSVLFAVAISVLWLRERPGRPHVLGAFATFFGVALIAWSS